MIFYRFGQLADVWVIADEHTFPVPRRFMAWTWRLVGTQENARAEKGRDWEWGEAR